MCNKSQNVLYTTWQAKKKLYLLINQAIFNNNVIII